MASESEYMALPSEPDVYPLNDDIPFYSPPPQHPPVSRYVQRYSCSFSFFCILDIRYLIFSILSSALMTGQARISTFEVWE